MVRRVADGTMIAAFPEDILAPNIRDGLDEMYGMV